MGYFVVEDGAAADNDGQAAQQLEAFVDHQSRPLGRGCIGGLQEDDTWQDTKKKKYG
jgi:hypothetical protein